MSLTQIMKHVSPVDKQNSAAPSHVCSQQRMGVNKIHRHVIIEQTDRKKNVAYLSLRDIV